MAEVTWTRQALDDLDAVCTFIARDAPLVAQVFAERIFKAVERLEQFPLLGRAVPEMGLPYIREIEVHQYRIVYHVRVEDVEVLTIHHGARPLGSPGESGR